MRIKNSLTVKLAAAVTGIAGMLRDTAEIKRSGIELRIFYIKNSRFR